MSGPNKLSCSRCKEFKPLGMFSPRTDRPRGYDYSCKACNAKKAKASVERHKDAVLARRKVQYAARADTEREKALVRYYAKHEEKKHAAKAWKQANPGWYRANNNERRRAKNGRTPAWANRSRIKEIYALAADWNSLWPDDRVHVDHIIPLRGRTVSGLHYEGNLRLIRQTDNLAKGNRVWPDMP